MISLILVDDHVIVRSGLKALIEEMGEYQIIQQYSNGKHLIDDLPAIQLPDLIIMDLGMPVMDGEETMRWLQRYHPTLKVLILTWDANERKIIELFRLGVRGYLLKDCNANILKKAIDDTYQTGYYHSELLQTAINKELSTQNDGSSIIKKITDREKLFLTLVCDKREYTYDQMASLMKVHRRTVDGYREALFEKFNIKSKTGLVLFAIKHGIVKI